jgi:hypothetical protein
MEYNNLTTKLLQGDHMYNYDSFQSPENIND